MKHDGAVLENKRAINFGFSIYIPIDDKHKQGTINCLLNCNEMNTTVDQIQSNFMCLSELMDLKKYGLGMLLLQFIVRDLGGTITHRTSHPHDALTSFVSTSSIGMGNSTLKIKIQIPLLVEQDQIQKNPSLLSLSSSNEKHSQLSAGGNVKVIKS